MGNISEKHGYTIDAANRSQANKILLSIRNTQEVNSWGAMCQHPPLFRSNRVADSIKALPRLPVPAQISRHPTQNKRVTRPDALDKRCTHLGRPSSQTNPIYPDMRSPNPCFYFCLWVLPLVLIDATGLWFVC